MFLKLRLKSLINVMEGEVWRLRGGLFGLVYDSLFGKPVQQSLQRVPLDPCGISFDTCRHAMKDSVGSGSIPGYMLLNYIERMHGADWVKG
jgi:hypothetical protein